MPRDYIYDNSILFLIKRDKNHPIKTKYMYYEMKKI